MDRKEEIRSALKNTSGYLLSHHRKENYDRCFTFSVGGRYIALCGRCTGIYFGILLGRFYQPGFTFIVLSGAPAIA